MSDTRSMTTPAEALVPYSGPPIYGVPSDLVITKVLDLDAEPHLWVPQSETLFFKPVAFSVSHGYFINLVRVTRSGLLSRHRHTGPVHAFTLRGSWHYLEHPWRAEVGDYSFEPPGDIHTLVLPADVDEMITLFHVTGSYIYVDPDGSPLGYEDVFTKLQMARDHYRELG